MLVSDIFKCAHLTVIHTMLIIGVLTVLLCENNAKWKFSAALPIHLDIRQILLRINAI